MKRKFALAAIVAILGTVMIFGVVLATTITVDGNTTDWPGNPTCSRGSAGNACVATDANETPNDVTGIRDQYDISDTWFTNNTTTAFWRMDTYATMVFTRNNERVDFCLDLDRNASTGYVDNTCNNIGTDALVEVVHTNIPSPLNSTKVYTCGVTGCNSLVGSGLQAISGTVMEVSAPISSLSITNGQVVSAAVYFDNADSDNDDHILDTGSFTITFGCGAPGGGCSPTAINLSSVTVSSGDNGAPVAALGVVSVAILAMTIALVVRRRQIRQIRS